METTGDAYIVALAAQDQSRAAAMHWLRTSSQFAVSAFTADGEGTVIISALADPDDYAGFVLASLAAMWDTFHKTTGETDAELFAKLMAALWILRRKDD